MRVPTFRRAAVLTLTAGALLAASGCFGSFNLTRKVYQFNKSASSDKFVQELVFLGLNAVPVYGVAVFADVWFGNLVEFWTGKNPIQVSSTVKVDSATTVKRVGVVKDDGTRVLTVETYKFGKLIGTTTISHAPGTNFMSFETALPNGVRESHISVMGDDGRAFVVNTTAADAQRALVAQH